MLPSFFIVSPPSFFLPTFIVEVAHYSQTHSQTLTDVYPDPSVTNSCESRGNKYDKYSVKKKKSVSWSEIDTNWQQLGLYSRSRDWI